VSPRGSESISNHSGGGLPNAPRISETQRQNAARSPFEVQTGSIVPLHLTRMNMKSERFHHIPFRGATTELPRCTLLRLLLLSERRLFSSYGQHHGGAAQPLSASRGRVDACSVNRGRESRPLHPVPHPLVWRHPLRRTRSPRGLGLRWKNTVGRCRGDAASEGQGGGVQRESGVRGCR